MNAIVPLDHNREDHNREDHSQSSLPAIDLQVPDGLETATFALG